MERRPKKLFDINKSLKERAETSNPLREVLLANSITGLVAKTDLDKLIETPRDLHRDVYKFETSVSNNTISSPSTSY